MPTPYRVGLYTLGCKVSQYETEAVAEAFENEGFLRCDFASPCDVYVINTCTVTRESNRKSRQIIRSAIETNPNALVMVMGCYAQNAPEELTAMEGVAYVSGTDHKMRLPQRAKELLADRPRTAISEVTSLQNARYEPMHITHGERTRVYVKIEDGCDNYCTYCAIPYARGHVRSREKEEILCEIRGLTAHGVREVVLTGIELASYGRDKQNGEDLAALLLYLQEHQAAERIRLGSLIPEIFTDAFLDVLERCPSVVPHFHVSMQSGSDGVLARMKRRYRAEEALAAIQKLKARIPRVMLTCDMIVGFPGESKEEFTETLDFVRKARFLSIHVFAYSKREGTLAAKMPNQLPTSVKSERSRILRTLQAEIQKELLGEVLLQREPLSVLMETADGAWMEGHTDSYLPVRVPASAADLRGEICLVLPERQENGVLYGSIL